MNQIEHEQLILTEDSEGTGVYVSNISDGYPWTEKNDRRVIYLTYDVAEAICGMKQNDRR